MTKEMIVKLAGFFWSRYEYVGHLTMSEVVGILIAFGDQIYYAIQDDHVLFLALYLKLDDRTLAVVKEHPEVLKDPHFLIEKMNCGGHVHFVAAVGDKRFIAVGIRETIQKEKPKSLSWYKTEMDKFHNIRIGGSLCHQ